MKNFNPFDKSKNSDILKRVIIGLLVLILVILIFSLGAWVGGTKARFSYKWAESYHKNFAGPRSGFFGDWQRIPPLPGDFIEGHGAFGEIIELEDNSFVIKGRGDIEKIVITTQDTVVKKGAETVKDGLSVGDQVTIIGSPNEEGQIEAKLIRVFNGEDAGAFQPPPPPSRFPRFPFFR